MVQTNIHNAQSGETFTYTNKFGYTTEIVVVRFTDKSVFCHWASGLGVNNPFRYSWNQFNKFSRKSTPTPDNTGKVFYKGEYRDAINFGNLT